MEHYEVYTPPSVVQVPTVPTEVLGRILVGFSIKQYDKTGHKPIYGKEKDHLILPQMALIRFLQLKETEHPGESMIQVLDGTIVYVSAEEKIVVDKLFRLKEPAAIYYLKGKKTAYHWILNPITIGKLKLEGK